MNRPIRLGIAAALFASVAGFVAIIVHDPKSNEAAKAAEPTAPSTSTGASDVTASTAPHFTSAKECQSCHADVYAEWQGSHHQIAYLNPEVRKLSDDFKNKECQSCHLPRPIAETGPMQRTLPRLTRPDEGVDCLTCHLNPDGRIAGKASSAAGCQPVADPRWIGVDLCGTCHNQHQTTDQWRDSAFAKAGQDCNYCHMPESTRTSGKIGRSHAYPGAHDAAMLKRAGELTVRAENGKAYFELKNVGAAHNIPTEERHRAFDVLVRFTLPAGPTEWQRVYRYRQPYRDEPGDNTQLPTGTSHTSSCEIPPGATKLEARLWYRLNPFAVDGDAASTLLAEHAEDLK